ncbi:hypothetical protein [Halobiforma nitratireducens]|uniref:Uncharacterized protein n=1 Tax=Halobiforma nitratireducens JCM 10879 TaxID=1227454 RepID=M0MDZ4_9EURY|nr:hypothetical protein [Halobiforma nitratireducens]EMA42625.1 hypothetical protein C446_04158 [Halobiforma nitratireducens JCM 10879]
MSTWIDPKPQSAEEWGTNTRREKLRADEWAVLDDVGPIEDTLERALAVELPYQDSERVRYRRTDLGLDDDPYTDGRAIVDGGVTDAEQIKLMARGYLWNGEAVVDNGERFKIQVRRPGSPDGIDPFREYEIWYRYQPGTITTELEREFEPTEPSETKRRTVDFEDVPEPLCHHLAKLELIRNPPFARHVLREHGWWTEYAEPLRWDPAAFDR